MKSTKRAIHLIL